jgi:hypothetical protein
MRRKSVIHTYLKKNKLRQDWLADKIGISGVQMSNYANVKVMPSPTNLVKFHDFTGGDISIEAMVREFAKERPRPSRKKESTKAKDSI